jgi:bacillithiol synthase
MKIIKKLDFSKVTSFTDRDIKYQVDPVFFNSFISQLPTEEGLISAIDRRSNFPIDRPALVAELKSQYNLISPSPLQAANLDSLLEETTFSVITAHQPSLFTGPLYFIYKIFSTINLAERLSNRSGRKIVPVFILGSEDHDFEEVNFANVFNKKIIWETDQSGPVGRFQIDNLPSVIEELNAILGESDNAIFIKKALSISLENAKNYNQFVFKLLNQLFGKYGLIIVNMDNPSFKKIFSKVLTEEILHQKSVGYINETQAQLASLGYSSQAHARDINVFYMQDGLRERIIKEDGNYKVNNTSIQFSESEMIEELNTNPENFSPNVALRPLYQESIWPNIAYIGGGGELAYWLERKTQFEAFNVFFPVLVRRNSALILKRNQQETIGKLGLDLDSFFSHEDNIINTYLQNITAEEWTVESELAQISKIFDSLKAKAMEADKSMGSFVEAEQTKTIKQIEQIESRIKRAYKKNEETAVNQIKNIKYKLFPNNGLQERVDNFLNFYINHGDTFFDELKEILDPLAKEFIILSEE